jgi:hypothetical protein
MAKPEAVHTAAEGGNLPFGAGGRADGPDASSYSARHLCPQRLAKPRGGARNRADRVSEAVSLRQALGVLRAASAAQQAGQPLNRHVTIHWGLAGLSDDTAAWATGRFLTLVRDWLRKRGLRTCWAWVRENGGGKGSHVHILLHVPSDVPWSGQRLRRWLERVTGQKMCARTIMTTRIGGRTDTAEKAPEVYLANLQTVVGYVLKGAALDAAERLGLDTRKPGGRIIGKRVAWSVNLGRSHHTTATPRPAPLPVASPGQRGSK